MSVVVEGDLDAAVVRRLFASSGVSVANVHQKRGKPGVQAKIDGYNQAARREPLFVLVDLDRDYHCAPDLVRKWLRERERMLCFRVAVRAVEAWLLGDRERLASWLRVKQKDVPLDPESIEDPKRSLIEIVRKSSSADIRQDMIPRPESGRAVGPAYSSRLVEFASSPKGWRPEVAAKACDSLGRARMRLTELAKTLKQFP